MSDEKQTVDHSERADENVQWEHGMAEHSTSVVAQLSEWTELHRFSVHVTSGPDTGLSFTTESGRLNVGTAEGASLRLSDPLVGRYHVEFESTSDGVVVRDIGGTSGVLLGKVRIQSVVARDELELSIGGTRLRLEIASERVPSFLNTVSAFGQLVGMCAPIRKVYSALERMAPDEMSVLIMGESGSGRKVLARALHDASRRADGPCEVVDCRDTVQARLEARIFGTEEHAFLGGGLPSVFERALGGTVLFHEVGDLSLEIQLRLVRQLLDTVSSRGPSVEMRRLPARIIASTSRDLRREVNLGNFRADLYAILSAGFLRMPSLAERLDDLAVLSDELLHSIATERGLMYASVPDGALLSALRRRTWPGNVRELRGVLEQWCEGRNHTERQSDSSSLTRDIVPNELLASPLRTAKDALVDRFERLYVTRLLEQTGGNVAEAARRAGVDRVTMFRTIRRLRLRESPEPQS